MFVKIDDRKVKEDCYGKAIGNFINPGNDD